MIGGPEELNESGEEPSEEEYFGDDEEENDCNDPDSIFEWIDEESAKPACTFSREGARKGAKSAEASMRLKKQTRKRRQKQKNLYLSALGMKLEDYGTNFSAKAAIKANGTIWEKERRQYGFDSRETYDLDDTFAEWLYSHVMMYLENAGRVVVLDDPDIQFQIEGDLVSQKEALRILLCHLIRYFDDRDREEELQAAARIWVEVLPAMWW